MGILSRGQGIFSIKKYCKDAELEVDIIENKGLFSSGYHIVITGEAQKIRQAKADIQNWVDKNKSK